jgi:hypothetical protein
VSSMGDEFIDHTTLQNNRILTAQCSVNHMLTAVEEATQPEVLMINQSMVVSNGC